MPMILAWSVNALICCIRVCLYLTTACLLDTQSSNVAEVKTCHMFALRRLSLCYFTSFYLFILPVQMVDSYIDLERGFCTYT